MKRGLNESVDWTALRFCPWLRKLLFSVTGIHWSLAANLYTILIQTRCYVMFCISSTEQSAPHRMFRHTDEVILRFLPTAALFQLAVPAGCEVRDTCRCISILETLSRCTFILERDLIRRRPVIMLYENAATSDHVHEPLSCSDTAVTL